MSEHKRNIFEKRINLKPYEYPELLAFKNAITDSFWVVEEYNFTSDIQDYHTKVTPQEKSVITKSMLAIAQIEVTVKRFWSDLYKFLPKPEIDIVGVTFGESETRHLLAYASLLELLGMDEMFARLNEYPALMKRVDYMEAFMAKKDESKQEFVLSLIMFSLFVEHISLFSQFLVIMSFNKHKNMFKGMSNAIEATSKEEEIHGRFGIALYGILKEEHPELFTDEFYQELKELADSALEAEREIIRWIFSEGDLDIITLAETENYIMHRYNNSLEALGLEPPYLVDKDLLKKTDWFTTEVLASKENDFFYKRSTDYSKRMKSITADDLF